MAKHNETGLKGEQIAEEFLVNKGYFLLERNWRHSHTEIDLILKTDEWLIIAEVKTRKGEGYGWPEEAVTPAKQAFIKKAAQAYYNTHPGYEKVRFDVIALTLDQRYNIVDLLHLEDAF